jgi:hypothetical protein
MVCGILIAVQAVARIVMGPVEDRDPELGDEERT